MKISEINYETPLYNHGENSRDVILNSATVKSITYDFGNNSELARLIKQRQTAISNCLKSGVLTDDLVISGDEVCTNYCNKIINKYQDCLDSFSLLAKNIKSASYEREKEELVKLRNEVEKRLNINRNFLRDNYWNNNNNSENADDNSVYERTIQENTNLDIKLGDIDRRLSGLSFDFTDENSGLIFETEGSYILSSNTGDDNNTVYGADKPLDVDKVTSYIDDNNIETRGTYIGYGGEITNEDGNIYKIVEMDGKRIYVIYNGFEGRNKEEASPILYMYEDENGHNMCYDRAGNPISYNTAMNILDISRCSQGSNCGYTDNYYHAWEGTPYKSEVGNAPTFSSPSINSINAEDENDKISHNYQWEDSQADPDGNVWRKVCDKTANSDFDDNSRFTPEARSFLNMSESGCYGVFTKDKGDMGTINVIVGKNYSNGGNPGNERYYSIKQPDGTYLYYDKYCSPVSANDWKDIVDVLK